MKKLIFILLILPVMALGQYEPKNPVYFKKGDKLVFRVDTITLGVKDSTIFVKSQWSKSFEYSAPPLDTAKVVMLVCDTTRQYNYATEFISCKEAGCKDSIKHRGSMFVVHSRQVRFGGGHINQMCYWMNGYSVRRIEYVRKMINGNTIGDSPVYQHLFYLTEDKSKIPKGMIVWDSREVK